MDYSRKVAEFLLSCEAVKLSPDRPFTWASGWKSPIYCDNRKTLAFPEIRSYIRDALSDTVIHNFAGVEVIAGVATGAIAQGALVADRLQLPFCYVRSAPKDHGLENMVEGHLREGQKVVVIEDLISTGGSSLKAVDALRKAGADVLGMVAIFSY
ncbi:MAG: orotate phosphoribosyltransferase, partial [Bacteroidales bacterium]